jgi:very-short-patch-repair endonuclease
MADMILSGARAFALVHGPKLAESGGELGFVLDVLGRVEGLDWSRVSYQVPFKDLRGGQRFADFVITLPSGAKLALEVDGWDKRGTGRGMDREDFDDFLLRQNALAAAGFVVLRFSNRQVSAEPWACAAELEEIIKQASKKSQVQSGYKSWFLVLCGAVLGAVACLLFF